MARVDKRKKCQDPRFIHNPPHIARCIERTAIDSPRQDMQS